MNFVLENCQLEWNREQGILYVHNKETGATVLRIYGLPIARKHVELTPGKMIDISVRSNDQASVPLY